MTTVFVYEHLSALGARGGHGPPLAPSLLTEGRAMLDAVATDFRAVPGVQVQTIDCDDEAAFRRLAALADFTLVIAPETDGVLEARCRWVEEAGGQLLGPDAHAVRLTADKLELFRHFDNAGIPTPRTWPLGAEPPNLLPVVWKPRDGAGSQDTFLLSSAAERARLRIALVNARGAYAPPLAKSDRFSSMIAQDYVAGTPVSVAILIGLRDVVALAPCAQRLSDDGRFRYLGGYAPLLDNLAERATLLALQAVQSVPGLRGYVGVDLVLGCDERHDQVIEINPRLTTSYVGLRRLAQFNIAEMLLAARRGEPLPERHWHSQRVEFAADSSTLANPSC